MLPSPQHCVAAHETPHDPHRSSSTPPHPCTPPLDATPFDSCQPKFRDDKSLKGISQAAVVPEGMLPDPLADEADEEDAFLEKVYEDTKPISAGKFPEGDADPMSRMFFCWLCPLLCKGYKVAISQTY